MFDPNSIVEATKLRRRALSKWDNEGGTPAPVSHGTPAVVPDMTNAELVQLRVRVIALENLLIAVLAEGSDRQLQVARDMADCISPQPGFTQHPLTVQAAKHMTDLADRAVHLQASSAL